MVVTIGVSTSPREDQRHEVGLVVDQVELAGALEQMGDVQRFPHLGVERLVLRIAARHDAIELAGGHAVERREQGDVDAARDQRLGQQAGDQLPRAIGARRRPPADRAEHRDAHAQASASAQDHAFVGPQPAVGRRAAERRQQQLAARRFRRASCRSVPDRLSTTCRRASPWLPLDRRAHARCRRASGRSRRSTAPARPGAGAAARGRATASSRDRAPAAATLRRRPVGVERQPGLGRC